MNLRKRHQRVKAEVHTSAMNDIMFFLLLFFLIALTVTNPNVIKLLLPKSSSGQAVSKKTISVTISQDLKYTVNNKPVKVEDMQNTLMGFKKLATELTIVLSVALLQPVKGAVIGLQWAFYMHGFGGEKDGTESHHGA